MIKITVIKLREDQKGKMLRFWGTNLGKKIPVEAVWKSSNGHYPKVGRGCGPEYIENNLFWDDKLHLLKAVRIEHYLTWNHVDSVPKNIITQHKKELIEAVDVERKKLFKKIDDLDNIIHVLEATANCYSSPGNELWETLLSTRDKLKPSIEKWKKNLYKKAEEIDKLNWT